MVAPTDYNFFHMYQKDQSGADWPVAPKIVILAGLNMGTKQFWKKYYNPWYPAYKILCLLITCCKQSHPLKLTSDTYGLHLKCLLAFCSRNSGDLCTNDFFLQKRNGFLLVKR